MEELASKLGHFFLLKFLVDDVPGSKVLQDPTLSVFSTVPNQVIGEMVLDGGGRFSPAGIDGLHTLSLLLSSQAAHNRATVDSHTHNITHDKSRLTLKRGHST